MKKRLLALLLVTVLVTGCGNKSKDESKVRDNKEVEASEVKTSEGADSNGAGEVVTSEVAYLYDGVNSQLHMMDEAGNLVATCKLTPSYEDAYIVMCDIDNGVVYYCENDSDYKHTLFSKDIATGYINIIAYGLNDPEANAVGDKIYITDSEYTDDGYVYTDYVCTMRDDGGYNKDVDYKEVTDTLGSLGAYRVHMPKPYNASYTVGAAIDRYGLYAATGDDGHINIILPNGEISATYGKDGENWDVLAFDGKYVIYATRVDYKTVNISYIDIITGETKLICDAQNDVTVLAYDDEMVFIGERDNSVYQMSKCTVKAYDIRNGEFSIVCENDKLPGATYDDSPGITGFTGCRDVCYYVAEEDKVSVWFRATNKNGNWTVSSTGQEYCSNELFENGDITVISESEICPYCNKVPVTEFYYERFILDSSFANADKINAILKEDEEDAKNGIYGDFNIAEDECEWLHGEYVSSNSYDSNVAAVKKLNDRYLTVQYDIYVYFAGAAHGYPYMEYFIFDLENGERISFMDLYDGDWSTLANTVAENAKGRFDEFSDIIFAESEEAFYEDILGGTTEGGVYIIMEKDYAVFAYPPYEIGPYASGYIEIDIPYSELGVELK